jgi:drug/metabolite transporter (DMT)-like permease
MAARRRCRYDDLHAHTPFNGPFFVGPRMTEATSRRNGLFALHVAVLLFGFAGLFGKWLVLSPVLIVLARTAIAAATLALLAPRLHVARGRFEPRLLANGVVLALHWVTFFEAIRVSSVAIGLLGYASFPLFTLLLERTLLHEPWRAVDLAVTALVVAGLVLLVPAWNLHDPAVQGLAWGMVSALTFALLAVINRAYMRRRSAIDLAFWQNAAAAVCLLPFAAPALAATAVPGLRAVFLLLVLGVLCTAFAHTLFIASLRTVTAHTASVVAALEPVYGIAFAWQLLGETPQLATWIGAALLVTAAVLASRPPQARGAAGRSAKALDGR